MSFFRNPEIKKMVWVCGIITVFAAVIGLFISIETMLIACGLALLLIGIFLLFTHKRYKRLADLSKQLDLMLHEEVPWYMNNIDEGELSILESELSKMTQTLRHQSDALKQDRTYLADSLADISHQMKTPLTSIRVIVSLLRTSDISDSRRMELVSDLAMLLDRTDWLIATLLKISRIDAGTVQFQKARVPVRLLLKKALEPLAIPLELGGQVVVLNGEDTAAFTGDLSWSAEALGNIIKNCMEHTPENGKIEICFLENPLYTEMIIQDNGTGISKEDLPHIFERFYRSKQTAETGVGIGLALARMIITKQNGTIKAENNQTKGSKFIIRFYKGAI